MRILLLGGQSPRHRDWARRFAAALQARGHRTDVLEYANWLAGTPVTDFAGELDRAVARQPSGPYLIAAKSIGTLLTLTGVARGRLHPAGALLLGFPLRGIPDIAGVDPVEIARGWRRLPPTVLVQNQLDPWGAAGAVRDAVAGLAEVDLRVRPGDRTHDYVDFPALGDLVDALAAGGDPTTS
jgi:hypothetical protein